MKPNTIIEATSGWEVIHQMVLLYSDRIQRLEKFGEDTDDLLSTINASFWVTLDDDDMVRAVDIRALAACVYRKLKPPSSEKCLSASVFYRLRRAFISLFNIPRKEITSETSLAKLLPWRGRKGRWREIQDHSRYPLPSLAWPFWLSVLCLVLVALFFILAIVGPTWMTRHPWFLIQYGVDIFFGAPLILFAVFGLGFLLRKLLQPLRREFPRWCETFGDLVKLTLARNYGKIASDHGVSSERDVLDLLRQLIAAELGTDIQEVTPETRFPEGLNLD